MVDTWLHTQTKDAPFHVCFPVVYFSKQYYSPLKAKIWKAYILNKGYDDTQWFRWTTRNAWPISRQQLPAFAASVKAKQWIRFHVHRWLVRFHALSPVAIMRMLQCCHDLKLWREFEAIGNRVEDKQWSDVDAAMVMQVF